FDATFNARLAALVPSASEVSSLGRERAYSSHYNSWKESGGNPRIFTSIAIAWNEGGRSQIRMLDAGTGAFFPSEWPAAWGLMKDWVESRAPSAEARPSPRPREELNLLDVPRFGDSPG